MNKILSIIQRQRESGSGAPFKYFVNERAGDTSQIMSKEIENTVDSAIETAKGQGVAKGAAPGVCPPNHEKDPVSNKCVPTKPGDTTTNTEVTKPDLTVDGDDLAGNS